MNHGSKPSLPCWAFRMTKRMSSGSLSYGSAPCTLDASKPLTMPVMPSPELPFRALVRELLFGRHQGVLLLRGVVASLENCPQERDEDLDQRLDHCPPPFAPASSG